ncbi:MAG: type II toxin-antitoxin system RelE/ParE family toxin [Deltaproteobacteria bacterium]|nr:type II toxin-antitoxin system RelE/ParE family toxin [Deltaproteobacteria bacterium]MBW2154166.1 type II toxin-antitoxin system RelE/ParE family toxin [Deltaproteobacteria bacterium]
MPSKPIKTPRFRIPEDIVSLIRNSHPELKRKIRAALEHILENPESGKTLKEELKGLRSYRVGRFRIIYRISPKNTVEIVTIGPRRIIYEETFRIIKRKN